MDNPRKVPVFGAGLALAVVGIAAATTDPYALPPTKRYLPACQHAVLSRHPGQILEMQLSHTEGQVLMRYTVVSAAHEEWLLICDLQTGAVVAEERLLDQAPFHFSISPIPRQDVQ